MNYPADGPLFLDSSGRSVFVQRFPAATNLPFQGTVLHLPAFAEEMNKSRAMVACQARAMAQAGYDVVLPDYFGTGDSGGEFCEASWDIWLEDMRTCLTQLSRKPAGPLVLWGLRLGGLMAMQLSEVMEKQPSCLILWNPVLNGERYMAQFLRLRLANSMLHGAAKEKAADLKAQLDDHGILEVAGYELPCALFQQISALKAESLMLSSQIKVFWRELSPASTELSLPAKKLMALWQKAGLTVDSAMIEGPQFWSTQEIARSDKLIESTTGYLMNPAAGEQVSSHRA